MYFTSNVGRQAACEVNDDGDTQFNLLS